MIANLNWVKISYLLNDVYSNEYRSDEDNRVRYDIIEAIDLQELIPYRKEDKKAIYKTLRILLEDSYFEDVDEFSNSMIAIIFSIADESAVKEFWNGKNQDEIFEIIMEMDREEIFPFLQKMEFDDEYFSPKQHTEMLKKMTYDDALQWYNNIAESYGMPGTALFNLFGIDGVKYLFDQFPEAEMKALIISLLNGTIDNETYYELYVKLSKEQKSCFLEILYYEQKYSIIRNILTTFAEINNKISLNEQAILALVERIKM